MCARVFSIGIPPQERMRLCMAASEEVCLQAAHYVRRAVQISNEDAMAEPYVRAVYICSASTVAAERVNISLGAECGSYLRDLLRASVASADASTSVPCWLTIMLEDTCIVQHAVFAVSTNSEGPHNWTPAVSIQPEGGRPSQSDVGCWLLFANPVPDRAAPNGQMRAPLEAPFANAVAAPANTQRVISTSPQSNVNNKSSLPLPLQVSATSSLRQPQRPQGAARDAPPLSSASVARPIGTTLCVHSVRTLAKAVATATPQPKPPQERQVQQREFQSSFTSESANGADGKEQPLLTHMPPPPGSYPANTAPSSAAPKRDTAPPVDVSGVYGRVEKYRVDAVSDLMQRRRAPCEEGRQQQQCHEEDGVLMEGEAVAAAGDPSQQRHTAPGAVVYSSGVPSEFSSVAASRRELPQQPQQQRAQSAKMGVALSTAASQCSSQLSRNYASRQTPDSLVAHDSPQADLVTPSNGRQWGDLAYRTRYAPRREELWDIANAVMTHNYGQPMIGPGEEPAYLEDHCYKQEAQEEL